MSGRVVIQVENLSKHYRLGTIGGATLREDLGRWWARVCGKPDPWARLDEVARVQDFSEGFWALRDISFEVREGEVLGVIGRNGAGKSTLLKILSRITSPTSGRALIRGRVGSLLEVGTGFHPELTGRENIYLNGAILGMTRIEIARKLDEIIEFAEMAKFIDTPVKRYSSGMTVRLAFAVAAHLEPEILIVDEVLAVGDAEFQKKCLGKMKDVAGDGRTILFVSHNMHAISDLCTRGILLSAGMLDFSGAVMEAVNRYTNAATDEIDVSFTQDLERPSIARVTVDREALMRRSLAVEIYFNAPSTLNTPIGGIVLRTSSGEPIWGSNGRFHKQIGQTKGLSSGVLKCEAKNIPLQPGQYFLSIWLGDWHNDYDSKIDGIKITIADNGMSALRPPSSVVGHLDWPAIWEVVPITTKVELCPRDAST